MNSKRVLIAVERYGLPLLLCATACAFVAAVGQAFKASPEPSLWAALIDTVTSDSNEAKGAAKVMHVLLTASLGWAAVKVYMATAGFKWDAFYARHLLRQHVVIVAGRPSQAEAAGLAAAASRPPSGYDLPDKSALAVDLALSLAREQRVLLSLPSITEGSRAKLWEAGVTVLNADLAMPEVLEAAGATRARSLIAMRDAHGDNSILTRAAVSPAFGHPELQCKCMIEPLEAKRDFRLEDYLEPETVSRVRVFNESELVARRIITAFPPDQLVAQGDRGVHVLLVGLGSVGQALLVQLARMGHYRSALKPKVTVVDRHVKALWKQAREAHPALETWLGIQTEETRIEDVGFQEIENWLTDERPITAVYVCTKDEIANLRISRLLLRRMLEREQSGGPPTPTVVALDPPGGCLLEDFAAYGAYKERFRLFSLVRGDGDLGSSPVAGSLLSEMDDARARLLHEDYCAKDDRGCAETPGRRKAAANLPWESLPETYREANRSSADHIEVKLRAVGRTLAPRGSAAEAPLTPEELEVLSRMEHDRWWADRALDGWTYAPERDNARKHHPDMVPYEQLSEPKRQLDRDNVQNILRIAAGSSLVLAMA